MAAEVSGRVDGVRDEELSELTGRMPELPNVRAAPADRFALSVHALVEKRAQAGWPNEAESDLAVFVLVRHPRQVGEAHGGQPFVDPVAQGTPLLGYMFFSSPDASRGRFIPIPVEENAFLEWLEDHQLGGCPVVAVYRNSKQMVTRRHGVSDSAWADAIRDNEPLATVESLMSALTFFHKRRVLTPTDCPDGIWKRGSAHSYIPCHHPEKAIQTCLEFALSFWFQGVLRVESEDKTNIGRIDVRLLKKGVDGGLAYWIILELKVIKSFTSGGSKVAASSNVETIIEGVKQAGSYRENRGAVEGMLEIYDLRKDKSENLTDRTGVTAALEMFSPPPKIDVWPLFGSAKHARNAGFTGA